MTDKEFALDSDLNLSSFGVKSDDNVTITTVNDMFVHAFKVKASDIHIEPREKEMYLRLRVDGNFIHYKSLPLSMREAIIARIKIMSYLRIDEHRLPQDGKITYKLF